MSPSTRPSSISAPPVASISTVDERGLPNLAPISSVFWLGHRAIIGVSARSQTGLNLQASCECVISLPSAAQVGAVDRLALTTGRDPVSSRKASVGYRPVSDKFREAGLTPLPSDAASPPRAAECPVNLEGRVVDIRPLEQDDPERAGGIIVVEVKVTRTHVHESLRMPGSADRVDPERWQPLIMTFQRYFGVGGQVHPSRPATIAEEWYRPQTAPAPAPTPA